MNRDLYFLPILIRALGQPDAAQALRRALAEIQQLGRAPGYQHGFRQFQRFIEEAMQHVDARRFESLELGAVRMLIAGLADDASDVSAETRQAVQEFLRSRPEWQREYEKFLTGMGEEAERPRYPDILLNSEDRCVGTIHVDTVPGVGSISGIVPGHYELAFDTGRVIWQGTLTRRDLVWSAAYPGRPLELAADTGGGPRPTPLEVRLLDGEIILRVLPGVESGRIELDITVSGLP